jgi:hypothetical protein
MHILQLQGNNFNISLKMVNKTVMVTIIENAWTPTKWQIGIPVSTGPPATIQNDVSETGAILTRLLHLHL